MGQKGKRLLILISSRIKTARTLLSVPLSLRDVQREMSDKLPQSLLFDPLMSAFPVSETQNLRREQQFHVGQKRKRSLDFVFQYK